jgi:integrase
VQPACIESRCQGREWIDPVLVRYAHRVFSLMLAHAVRDGRLAPSPAEGVRLAHVVRGEPTLVDDGQVVDLVEAAEPYGLLVRFLTHIGLRWGEMSALRWADLLRRRMRLKVAFVEVRDQPFASGEGPRRDLGFRRSPRGESNS